MVFGMWFCSALLPLAVVVASAIFLGFWLVEKKRRDELVLNLLIEIHQIINEIGEMTDAETRSRNRNP